MTEITQQNSDDGLDAACSHCPYWGSHHNWGVVWIGGWRGTIYRCACGATMRGARNG